MFSTNPLKNCIQMATQEQGGGGGGGDQHLRGIEVGDRRKN
jgi:hypothetical protein